MSRIIAAVAIGVFGLVGTAAVGAEYNSLSDPSNQTVALTDLTGSLLSTTQWLPLVLLVGLLIAVGGVIAR